MTLKEAWAASGYRNQCKNRNNRSKLCKFETLYEVECELAEECVFCGKRMSYAKMNGKVDNRQYLPDHIRDTVQPYGITRRLFSEIYGTETLRSADQMKEAKEEQKPLDPCELSEKARKLYKKVKSAYNSGKSADYISQIEL